MTYQDNGISFNDVKFRQGLAVGAIPLEIGGVSSPGLDNGDGIINVVDIDWNGAVLPNANITTGESVTIKTSGQLLNLINEMQKEIYTLAAAVIAIGNKA
jgi:hypothetical protein